MAECQLQPAIRARLAGEESLSAGEARHVAGCDPCRALVARAKSLDLALARSARMLVSAELHPATLALAQTTRGSATRNFALAMVAATAMVLILAGAAVSAGLLRPAFDDAFLRSDPGAYAAFDECLDDAGYSPRPMPTGDPTEADLAYMRTELRCMVESGIGQVDGDDPAEVAYADAIATGITQCLRDEAWDIPNPELEPLGRYLEVPSGVVSDDPTVQAEFNRDLEACGSRYGVLIHE